MLRVMRDTSRARRRWRPYRIPAPRLAAILRNLYCYRYQLWKASAKLVGTVPSYPRMGVIPVPYPLGPFGHTYPTPRGVLPNYVGHSRLDLLSGISFGRFVRPPNPRSMIMRPHTPVPPRLPLNPCANQANIAATPEHKYRDLQPYKIPRKPDRIVSRKPLVYQTWRKYATQCLSGIMKTCYRARLCCQQRSRNGEGTKPVSELRGRAGSNAPSLTRVETVNKTFSHAHVRRNIPKPRYGHTCIGPLCWFDMKARSYIPHSFRELPSHRGENRDPITSQPQIIFSSSHQQNVVTRPAPLVYFYGAERIPATGVSGHCTGFRSPPRSASSPPHFGRGAATSAKPPTASQSTMSLVPRRRLPTTSVQPYRGTEPREHYPYEEILINLLKNLQSSFRASARSRPAAAPAGGSETRKEAPPDSTVQKRDKSPPVRTPKPVVGLMKEEPPSKRPRNGAGSRFSLAGGAGTGSATSCQPRSPAAPGASAASAVGAIGEEARPGGTRSTGARNRVTWILEPAGGRDLRVVMFRRDGPHTPPTSPPQSDDEEDDEQQPKRDRR